MTEFDELQRAKASKRRERFGDSLPVIPNENGNGYSFSSVGFKYGDFNRAGLISLPAVFKHFDTARHRFVSAYGLTLPAMQAFFLLQVNIDISMELYKTAGLAIKLKNISELSHVGRSTISIRKTLLSGSSGTVLAIHSSDFVHVNSNTRKAEPLSPPFKQKAENVLSGSPVQSPSRLRLPVVDEKHCYRCTLVVKNSDMDENDHTTQIMYVEYAFESAARATASGYYKKLRGDICNYCPKTTKFSHTGESAAGDELHVITWEDEANPLLIYFIIRKESQDICHAKMEFYDPYLHSNI